MLLIGLLRAFSQVIGCETFIIALELCLARSAGGTIGTLAGRFRVLATRLLVALILPLSAGPALPARIIGIASRSGRARSPTARKVFPFAFRALKWTWAILSAVMRRFWSTGSALVKTRWAFVLVAFSIITSLRALIETRRAFILVAFSIVISPGRGIARPALAIWPGLITGRAISRLVETARACLRAPFALLWVWIALK